MGAEFVYDLMRRIKSEATDDALFEASGLDKNIVKEDITRDSVSNMTNEELEKQFEQYRGMLDNDNASYGAQDVKYYTWLEDEMGKRGLLGETKTEEGKIPNPKDTDGKKIDALREDEEDNEEEEVIDVPQDEESTDGNDDAEAPEPVAEPESQPDVPADDAPAPEVAPADGNSEVEDLVANMAAAKEHYEKGNLKVAKELLKLVQDSLKTFKDQIKAEEDAQKAAEAPRPEEGTEDADKMAEGKVNEQDYTTVARGISDEEVAKRIAQEKKGVVVADESDEKKFMVIVKEKFTSDDVNKMVDEARKDANALAKKLTEEAEQQKEEQKKANEQQDKQNVRREQILAENNMMLDILAQIVTGQTASGIKKTFETKKDEFIKDKSISEDKVTPEGWTEIMSSVIEGYEFTKKKEMLESLSSLYGMQKVHIDEKKNQLLDKLLKTDGQDD